MSTTARICDKWDIELPEPGDKPWFLDWALKSPQQVGLHLTARRIRDLSVLTRLHPLASSATRLRVEPEPTTRRSNTMHFAFDSNELSDLDRKVLAVLAGVQAKPEVLAVVAEEVTPAKAAPAPKVAPKPAAKPEPKPEPVVETVVEETPEPVVETVVEETPATASVADRDAVVAAATKLVTAGKTAQVKTALAVFGAKRVSELEESMFDAFLTALEA